MTKVDPSMGVQEIKGRDGVPFARLVALPDGSNLALARTNTEGGVSLVMFMVAVGVASVTKIGTDDNAFLDNEKAAALMAGIDAKKAVEMQAMLSDSIRTSAPQIASLHATLELLRGFDRQPSPAAVAAIHTCDDTPFLVVRTELSDPSSPISGTSALRIFGEGVEETFRFSDSGDRDATFLSPNRLTPFLASLAARQTGHELLSDAARRSAPRR